MLFQNYESVVVQSYTCTESWQEFQSPKGILAMCSNVNLFMWLDMMDITCHLLGRYWLWRRNQNTRGTPNDVVVFIHWNHLTSILGSVTLKTRVNAPYISQLANIQSTLLGSTHWLFVTVPGEFSIWNNNNQTHPTTPSSTQLPVFKLTQTLGLTVVDISGYVRMLGAIAKAFS